MIVTRREGDTDNMRMMAVLSGSSGAGFSGLGIAWALVAQVVGYVIQGIGLGFSVHDAIRGAGEQIPAGQQVQQEDISVIADELSKKFPTTSKSSWENLLNEGLAGKVAPPTTACPPGYMRDPATGACIEIQKAGILSQIPAWGWVAIAGLGILVLPKLGLFR